METIENDSKVSNVDVDAREKKDSQSSQGLQDSKDIQDTQNPSDIKIKLDGSEARKLENEGGDPQTESKLEGGSKTSLDSKQLEFKVIYNKVKYDVNAGSETTVKEFKKQLQGLVGVPDSMQKLMYKGLLQDDQTLGGVGITKGVKVMLVGSTLNDVLAVSVVNKQDASDDKSSSDASSKEPLCRQKMHKKVLDKGVPDDVMPGIRNVNESLPPVPLSGMLNKHGGKVRLTFKLEMDQLWLGTKERTEKLPMGNIKNVVSEPIEGHEEYHIMGLQLGPTEASRYWVYWVPAQYVEAIKTAVLGHWQLY